MASRDLTLAKQAYGLNDADLSKLAHSSAGGEAHKSGGDFVKNIIFGGLDGIMATFATVAGVEGAGLSPDSVLVLGFANLIANALAMGVGDYLSEKAENEFVKNEMKREEWELDNYIEGEKREMIELYTNKGMTNEDATKVIDIMSRYKKIFLDTMMVEELGLMVVDPDDSPLKQGIVMFFSFIIFGIVPLLAYIFGFTNVGNEILFGISIGLTGLTLMGLGVLKGHLTSQGKFRTALEMLINGGLASVASYFVGWSLERLIE